MQAALGLGDEHLAPSRDVLRRYGNMSSPTVLFVLAELLRRAAAEPAVTTVRASISPGNTASLATIAGFGFVEVGEAWDDEDGLETVFEVRVR